MCKNVLLFSKFSLFSRSGKMNIKIPCSPCDVATLTMCTAQVEIHCCPEYTGSRLQRVRKMQRKLFVVSEKCNQTF